MSRFIAVFIALLAGAAAAIAAVYFGLVPGLTQAGPSSVVGTGSVAGVSVVPKIAPDRVVALARLEPATGLIDLGGVPGDKIVELAVVPGQLVHKDDPLIVFDSRTLRELDAAAAKSQLDESIKRLAAEQAHADALVRSAQLAVDGLVLDDLELSAQRTKLQALEKGLEIARRDYDRLSKLDPAITSKQELEHAGLMRDRAEIELTAAKEMIKKLETGRDLRSREAQATLDQAKAGRAKVEPSVPIDSLRQALAAAEERLRSATLRAPCEATVLQTFADEGDTVGQTPLVRLADLRSMIARAEVYETQAAAVQPGQRVEITADALPKPIAGKVERVGTVVGPNQILSLDPRQTADNRVVEVRILLDDAAEASRFVNLQVTVTIATATK